MGHIVNIAAQNAGSPLSPVPQPEHAIQAIASEWMTGRFRSRAGLSGFSVDASRSDRFGGEWARL